MTDRQPFSPLDEGAALSERPGWPMNVHLEAHLEQRLDPARLEVALQAALARHPMARARRVPTGGLETALEWEFPGQPDRPVLVTGQEVAAFLSQPLPLSQSPRIRVLLDRAPADGGRAGERGDRVVLSSHHAALDGASAVTLLRTIAAAYAGAADDGGSGSAATVTSGTGVTPAARSAAVGAGLRQVFLARPVDRVAAPGSDGAPGYGVSQLALTPEVQRALVEGRPAGATVNDVLISALHLAMDHWNRAHQASAGLFSVVMPVRSAGPEVVGNATTQATVYTRPDQRSTPAHLLEAVQAQTSALKALDSSSEPSEALSGLAALPVAVRERLPALAGALTRERSVASTRLSNLGRIGVISHPGFTVASLWFSPPCRPPQSIVVGVAGYAGACTLTARWCAPDFDQTGADLFLAQLGADVAAVLGLGSTASAGLPVLPDQRNAVDDGAPLPSGMKRTLEYARLFREEQQQPEAFYRFLAKDTVAQVERYRSLTGTRALDIGGGPGYLADALEAAGARCDVVDYSGEELFLFGRDPRKSLIGDGCRLPVKDGCLDLVVSSNVLEHVPDPRAFLREAVRVLKPDGVAYIAFTNWFSPWGGHETSPWHYLGGERAVARYERTWHLPPKNRFAESLFPVHVGETLSWVRQQPELQLLDAFPRYLPRWSRALLAVPGVREVATWNLVMILAPAGARTPVPV